MVKLFFLHPRHPWTELLEGENSLQTEQEIMQKSKQEQEKHLQSSREAPERHYSRPMPD